MLARGILNRLTVDDWFPGRAILNAAQFCVDAMPKRGRSSANQVAFKSNPAGLCMGSKLDFAREASDTGQFV